MNPGGAMNTIERLSQVIEDNGYADYTDLDQDRQTEYKEAWEDLQYWTQLLTNVWSKDVAGNDDEMEVEVQTGTDEDGSPVFETKKFGNPHGPTDVGTNSTDLPDRPNGGNV